MGRNNGNKQKARVQRSKRSSDPTPTPVQQAAVRQARLKLNQVEATQVANIEAGRPALPVELKRLEQQFGPKRTNAR